MDLLKRNQFKLLLLACVVIGLAYLHPDLTKRTLAQCAELLSKVRTGANSAAPLPEAGASSGEAVPEAAAPLSDGGVQTQATVEAYMRKNAAPQCVLSFMDWSDFSSNGQTSAITAHYRVQRPFHQDTLASVRFTVLGGSVIKAELVQPAGVPSLERVAPVAMQAPGRMAVLAAQSTPAVRWTPPARPVQVIDRFSSPLFAAEHEGGMTLHLSSAFSLSELEQAKAKAEAERKPLGFLMVWGQFFDHEADVHSKGSDSALVHFYKVFHQQLVLVFVRHETELPLVPVAVRKGFSGMNEGGFAPNMAVTDASASEFIVEIPYRGLNSAGREPIFADGGRKIDQWLATHPMAMPTPAPVDAGGAGGAGGN